MYNKYSKFIQEKKITHIHIFLHHNADPDAICSAEAIGEFTSLISSSVEYSIYSDGINTSAKRVMESQEIIVKSSEPENVNSTDIIITVDTSNYSQLGKFQDWVKQSNLPIILFDHHDEGELHNIVELSIYDKSSPSTCMLLMEGYYSQGLIPSAKISTLLICGHIYDTRRFIYGTSAKIFRMIAFLIEKGGDYDLANDYLQNVMPLGERIARLKAARRLSYDIIDNIIVVTSNVGAFESSSARSFITLGADIVFIIAEKDKEIRGSARTRISDQINVGEILNKLAVEYGGTGGGHAAAAGLNIKSNLSKNKQKMLLKQFIELVRESLNSIKLKN